MGEPAYDVVIVGLGPVGAALAGLAALEGLKVVAIDRETGMYPLPRAAVVDDEVMRIFQKLGVADAIAATSRPVERYEFISAGDDVLVDIPVLQAGTVSGWPGSFVIHQPSLEAILRRRLASLQVDVRLGHAFSGLSQDDAGVAVTVAGPDGAYTLRAHRVIGCDGARSGVRDAMGATYVDYDFDEPWLVIDAIAPDETGLPSRLLQICDPERPATYLKMTDNRYRWEFMLLPGETPEALASDESIHGLLAKWTGGKPVEIERRAVYRFHALLAEQWRIGRVLIAGDAAHQMPPFAGQGMCAGMRDAMNLSWKLGMVARGEAADALLDTYQAEREGHVRGVIEMAINMGRIVHDGQGHGSGP